MRAVLLSVDNAISYTMRLVQQTRHQLTVSGLAPSCDVPSGDSFHNRSTTSLHTGRLATGTFSGPQSSGPLQACAVHLLTGKFWTGILIW